jgi:hypothetical protein
MRSSCYRQSRLITFIILAIVLGIGWPAALEAQSPCDYFASPNGYGNGFSMASPFSISDFWGVAGPGKTLCLLDGVYTNGNSMIRPWPYLSGVQGNPITVRAINDGAVLIDGQSNNVPLALHYNDYWVIEGMNLANSSSDVAVLYAGADYNIIRRVVAWNAADANTGVFGIHYNTGNLLEDVAGFGTARKIFQASYYSNSLTIRRAWGMWNRSTFGAWGMDWPKMTYSIAYENYDNTCENCIATQDIDADSRTDSLYSLLGTDWFPGSDNKCANSRYLGSIAYTTPEQNTSFAFALHSSQGVNCMKFENVAVNLAEGETTASLQDFTAGFPRGHAAWNITEIGAGDSSVGYEWSVSNREKVADVTSATNIWNGGGTMGARICYQYHNGVLTDIPLWPWPMNQRIMAALQMAGRRAVDVTATMERMFGAIPAECRAGGIRAN